MFPPFEQTMDEDHFANINYSKNIDCILPTCELMVNFRINSLHAKKPCFVYAEKMDFKGLIQVRLTEKADQRRMYITTVDSSNFHELKQDQSLHVTFGGFIENLVRILQDCQLGKLEINLVQIANTLNQEYAPTSVTGGGSGGYQLQFVETRPFKNLVHLCLPSQLAPLNVVLFYMHSIMDALQKKSVAHEHSTQQLQHELMAQSRRIEQLNADNEQLRANLVENTQSLSKRHSEEMAKMEENLRQLMAERKSDEERYRKSLAGLQNQLEKQSMEQANMQAEKIHLEKRCEALNEELCNSKGRIAALKEQLEKFQAEIQTMKNAERKTEMLFNDARRQVGELQEELHRREKARADLIAELEAERKILQTKRQALEMATAEIAKANEIILVKSQDIVKLRRALGLRTEVALEQEKAIRVKDRHIKQRDDEIRHMQYTIEALRDEIPKELESMKEFAATLEARYKEQIKALESKLNDCDKENIPQLLAAPLLVTRKK